MQKNGQKKARCVSVVVGIVGSRDAKGMTIDDLAFYLPEKVSAIVSGGAKGVDEVAERYAKQHHIRYVAFLPDYTTFGKQAPLIRNTQIVQACDKVLAFWDYQSKGTKFTIGECIRLGVPVEIISLFQFK